MYAISKAPEVLRGKKKKGWEDYPKYGQRTFLQIIHLLHFAPYLAPFLRIIRGDFGSYIRGPDERQFAEVTFDGVTFDKVTFDRITFDKVTFDKVTFDKVTFDKNTFNKVAFEKVTFDKNTS
jgi:hypothetical protein